MKVWKGVSEGIREFDLFAPNITLRYQSDNDYKTWTGAVLSLILIVFFGVVFINTFITMVNRQSITFTSEAKEEEDPSFYRTQTPEFMFAVGLSGVNLNVGNKYFDINAIATTTINGTKSKHNVTMVPCTAEMWYQLGQNYQAKFIKLKLSQWLCPQQGQLVQLQGKYSSDVFKYIKVVVTDCTPSSRGCYTDTDIQNYINVNEYFSFNYYYMNNLINVESKVPVINYLDDSMNIPFTKDLGATCNFYLQNYHIQTDQSLMPYNQFSQLTGTLSTQAGAVQNFLPKQGEYVMFYVRKSPSSVYYTRKYTKIDELLSYIGGLFGLIAMIVHIPLVYYNTCCFQLSLATDLFTSKDKKLKQIPKNGQSPYLQSQDATHQEEPHSVNRFNFLTYLLWLPFFVLKKLGYKSLQSKWFSPYYDALKQARQQIDIGKIIQKQIYFQRVTRSLLNEDQRILLHLSVKESLSHLKDQDKKFKFRQKLQGFAKRQPYTSQKSITHLIPQIDQLQKVTNSRQAFKRVSRSQDVVSKRIIQNLDPYIYQNFLAESEQKQLENQSPNHKSKEICPNYEKQLKSPPTATINNRKQPEIAQEVSNSHIKMYLHHPLPPLPDKPLPFIEATPPKNKSQDNIKQDPQQKRSSPNI